MKKIKQNSETASCWPQRCGCVLGGQWSFLCIWNDEKDAVMERPGKRAIQAEGRARAKPWEGSKFHIVKTERASAAGTKWEGRKDRDEGA